MDIVLLNVVILIYLLVVGYLGYKGWKTTKCAEDYMVGGRKIHPFVMAMSYGATFISTAAIVGFGGIAGIYGMSLLWLPFLNIFIGVLIAFVFFGKRTRKMGHNLGALTFPELLSKRFESKFIQWFSGLLIFCAMPIYAAAVLIGAARFIETTLGISFEIALLVFSIIIAAYVVMGGLKGVMYTDAFQASIMFLGMLFLLYKTYSILGGVTSAHLEITNFTPLISGNLIEIGHLGLTSMPEFGSQLWWTIVSSIILGVGTGVLAQPQLVVRFMTVKSNRELNRAVLIGGIFIFVATGTSYVVGALSNAYFMNTEGILSIAATATETFPKGNVDSIIPLYINKAMPEWFIYVFLVSLLAAAMSTLSSQFHAQGTSIGRDVYETITGKKGGNSVHITRIGIIFAIVIAVVLGYVLPGGIIAKGTALFFGLCTAAFLPIYALGLFWKRTTKEGAISGLLSGTFSSIFCLVFLHKAEAVPLGISKMLFGREVLISSMPWPYVDPVLIAFPISFIVTILVSLLTKAPSKEHLDKCFKGI
ncbi:SSS sodium solute transporter superfamily [Methanococcus vannielii SB]|uniref:SSS sodium solute transporter superfamily n=1 Tax=Methanococcus vannielii (strain ATCC 35089 / DSM 1224 / JCM 13029 / OCM 148 / SB) TaxID=406327 RepID=A6UQY3_METVS|nr:sodium:solute symporter family protein [Methanococcus vannielii]ABR54905.1 SSS sodium solute transporter superfamily [Methanococcus vannielii SB]